MVVGLYDGSLATHYYSHIMAQTPQVARFSYGSAGAYQLPLSNGALDGFGVRNLGVLNVQGGSNPTMPVWSQPQPRDCDDGLVGPGGWNGHMGRYYGSDAVATDSSRFWGTNQEDDGARLHPGNMIDEIVLPPDIVTQTPGMMTNERVHYQWPLNKDCLYYSRILNPQARRCWWLWSMLVCF